MIDVSIIVAAFNEEKYLARCLHSLACQTFTGKYEVIVVDDGSTGCTADIIQKFKNEYPEIFTSIKQKNLGQGIARNNGISIAK
ncbi:glycosyltransferase family A protein [Lactobacillus sp. ESL0701]|uniref:glycosyltransferase family 2 protein n=1 Tax=Lactobacillus sp. ESL0701 TaxID=2983217 RepID=UPI0023F969FA|nr:glycosyltransferase family A protein [Lactobacillus sp. ESL0701]MDF7672251.1 glycosyltransferase family A protein [Lactobacillus sp. ESL0701]